MRESLPERLGSINLVEGSDGTRPVNDLIGRAAMPAAASTIALRFTQASSASAMCDEVSVTVG